MEGTDRQPESLVISEEKGFHSHKTQGNSKNPIEEKKNGTRNNLKGQADQAKRTPKATSRILGGGGERGNEETLA